MATRRRPCNAFTGVITGTSDVKSDDLLPFALGLPSGGRTLKNEIRETRKHAKLMRDDATLISKRRVNIVNVESDSCYVRHETVQKNDIRVSINFVANIKTVSILGPVGWSSLGTQ